MKITSAILCSSDKKFDRTKTLASYCCSSCGNNTVVQASMEEPYCVHCGKSELRPLTVANRAGRLLLKTDESELATVKCPGCSTHLFMDTNTVMAHTNGNTGHLHCPVCASSITFASDVADNINDTDNDIGLEPDTDLDTDVGNQKPEEDENKEIAKVKRSFILANLVKGKPEFVVAGNKVFCLVNNVVIATSNEDTNQEAEEMQKALEATKEGEDFDLEKVLNENDFELAIVDADIAQELEDEAQEQVEEKVEEQVEQVKAKFKSVVSVAMAGCNRGLFDSENHLILGLEKALVANGHSPEIARQIADEIAEDVADDYADEIMRIAFDLLAKPEAVQAELAKTVAQVKPARVVANTNTGTGLNSKSGLPKPFVQSTVASVAKTAHNGGESGSKVLSIIGKRKLI